MAARKRDNEGRFDVEDKGLPSIGAAIAYAGHLSINERRNVTVRELAGQPLARWEYDTTDGATNLVRLGGAV